jgi:glycosyltransferase involved in cell wall biosynthesis
MNDTGQVSISICMMVRDEEENLQRSLPSLKNLADELIVIDTGSKDKSIEIAKSFGAKVYEHPWEDDFSKHRNQSVSYATSDWIFIFDADEELIVPNESSIRELKQWLLKLEEPCCSAAIVLHDIQQDRQVMRFNSVRLFRRGHVEYLGTVHNAPKVINGDSKAPICNLIELNHYGYDLTPEKALIKRKRTESLLLKRIEQDPDDVAAYFYLVQAYTAYSEYNTAIKYIFKYEEVVKKNGVEFNGSIFCTAVSVFRKVSDKENCQRWLLKGLKKFPRDLDLLMNLTEFGVWQKKLNLVIQGGKGFMEVYEEYSNNPLASGNRFTYANVPEAAAYCLFHLSLGLLQESSEYLNRLGVVLNDADPKYAAGMKGDVATVLDKFGWHRDGWSSSAKPNMIGREPKRKIVNLSKSLN